MIKVIRVPFLYKLRRKRRRNPSGASLYSIAIIPSFLGDRSFYERTTVVSALHIVTKRALQILHILTSGSSRKALTALWFRSMKLWQHWTLILDRRPIHFLFLSNRILKIERLREEPGDDRKKWVLLSSEHWFFLASRPYLVLKAACISCSMLFVPILVSKIFCWVSKRFFFLMPVSYIIFSSRAPAIFRASASRSIVDLGRPRHS